jgi:hypothetical protein
MSEKATDAAVQRADSVVESAFCRDSRHLELTSACEKTITVHDQALKSPVPVFFRHDVCGPRPRV